MPPPSPCSTTSSARERLERLEVALARGGEEATGQLVALLLRRLVARPALGHVAACASGELPGVGLALAHDRGDVLVRVVEDVVQQESGPLLRRQALEQDEEGHRERVGQLGPVGRVVGLARDQRFREPLAHVAFAPDARRAQHVDREPGDHRGHVRARGASIFSPDRGRGAAAAGRPAPRPRPRSRCRASGRRLRTRPGAAPRRALCRERSSRRARMRSRRASWRSGAASRTRAWPLRWTLHGRRSS